MSWHARETHGGPVPVEHTNGPEELLEAYFEDGKRSDQPQHSTRLAVRRPRVHHLVPRPPHDAVPGKPQDAGPLHRRDDRKQDASDGAAVRVEHHHRAEDLARRNEPARRHQRTVRAATDAPPARPPPDPGARPDMAAPEPPARSSRRPVDRCAKPRPAGRGLRHVVAALRARSATSRGRARTRRWTEAPQCCYGAGKTDAEGRGTALFLARDTVELVSPCLAPARPRGRRSPLPRDRTSREAPREARRQPSAPHLQADGPTGGTTGRNRRGVWAATARGWARYRT